MTQLQDKRILFDKSGYPMADKYKLEIYMTMYNSKYYKVKIYDKGTQYLIIAIPRIEEV